MGLSKRKTYAVQATRVLLIGKSPIGEMDAQWNSK